jgi:hypothetical protein
MIELFYDPVGGSVFASCTSGACAVAVRHLRPSGSEGRMEAISQYPPKSSNLIEAEAQLLRAKVEEEFEQPGLNKRLDELTERTHEVANRLYTQWMEANDIVITDAEQCRSRMIKLGIAALLGNRPDLLRALALTSLVASHFVPEPILVRLFSEEELDWASVVSEFDRVQREQGYRLITRMAGLVLSTV